VALNKGRELLGVMPGFDYAKPDDFQNPVVLVKEDAAVRPHHLRNNKKHTESILRAQREANNTPH
jgi:hypothetical protein